MNGGMGMRVRCNNVHHLRIAVVALLLVFQSVSVRGLQTNTSQLVSEMTPERIQEAITLANQRKASIDSDGCYKLSKKRGFVSEQYGCFTTPFSRVYMAARDARTKYRTFTEADVTPEMIAPEVTFLVPSQKRSGTSTGSNLDVGIINVEAVVVTPYQSRERDQAIQPTRSIRFRPVSKPVRREVHGDGHDRDVPAIRSN